MTKLLLTKIPMFREVIISSFHCVHCGEKNSDVQSGAAIMDKGVTFTLKVTEPKVGYVGTVKPEHRERFECNNVGVYCYYAERGFVLYNLSKEARRLLYAVVENLEIRMEEGGLHRSHALLAMRSTAIFSSRTQ